MCRGMEKMETRWPDVMAWRSDGTTKDDDEQNNLFFILNLS